MSDVVNLLEMQGQDVGNLMDLTILDDDMETASELESDDLEMVDRIGCGEGKVPAITLTLGPNMEVLKVALDSTINRMLKC